MLLLQMSAMGSVLIVLTMLLRRILGNKLSPGCYLALWTLAGVRLLLPMTISSPFSVYQFLPSGGSGNKSLLYEPITSPTLQEIHTAVQPVVQDVLFVNILTVLWMWGAITCFGIIVVKHWRSRAMYNASLPLEDAFISHWMQNHKLYRKYQIRVCQQVATPLTYGVICPVILLPAGQEMSDEELHLVLLHEWNHIRHFDTLWQWVMAILCSIHWFNPLVYAMFILCRQDMELFCDLTTVKAIDAKKRSTYAYLLLNQAERCVNTSLFSQFCFTGYRRMEERMKLIMKQKPFGRKARLATIGILCIGVLCFTTTAMGESNSTMAIQAEDMQLVWPVLSDDAVITLPYGERVHPISGETVMIDHICIGGAEKGTDIIASASGVVKETGFDAKRGYYLVLQCENDTELHYGHCEKVLVEAGDRVDVYDKIATLGQTGDATGPCLSFAVYQNGKPVYLYTIPEYNGKGK